MKCGCDWQGLFVCHVTRKKLPPEEFAVFMPLHLAADSQTIANMGTSFLERPIPLVVLTRSIASKVLSKSDLSATMLHGSR